VNAQQGRTEGHQPQAAGPGNQKDEEKKPEESRPVSTAFEIVSKKIGKGSRNDEGGNQFNGNNHQSLLEFGFRLLNDGSTGYFKRDAIRRE
jgi:hypothetical protein